MQDVASGEICTLFMPYYQCMLNVMHTIKELKLLTLKHAILEWYSLFHWWPFFSRLLFRSFGVIKPQRRSMSTRGRKYSSLLRVEMVGRDTITQYIIIFFFNILFLNLLFILDVRTLSEYFFCKFSALHLYFANIYSYRTAIIASTRVFSTQSPF